jgi:hypothetical protein
MVETISPVVHGGRNRTYWMAMSLHTLGAILSAALLGAGLGALGSLMGAPFGETGLYVLAAIALLYLLREAFGLPIPVPSLRKQVPAWWRTFYSRNTTALLYGLGLGVGYFTYLSYGTFVVVSIAVVVSGDPLTGALVGGCFGLARSAAVALAGPVERVEELSTSSIPPSANALALGLCCALALVVVLS